MKAILISKRVALVFLAALLAGFTTARADSRPASLFDPARHMRIAEVKPGMKGYGLSVFSGTKIEKFDVVVVDVVKNFNPKYDVILIRCPQEFLKNTGPIEGMSGSPIFLYDDSGRARWRARLLMDGHFPRIAWPASSQSNTCSNCPRVIRLKRPG